MVGRTVVVPTLLGAAMALTADEDVALEPALHVRTELREFLAEHRLTQLYWYRRFSDLIVESAWRELPSDKR